MAKTYPSKGYFGIVYVTQLYETNRDYNKGFKTLLKINRTKLSFYEDILWEHIFRILFTEYQRDV